jgi:tetratricopeptide (TPR) repeat protein
MLAKLLVIATFPFSVADSPLLGEPRPPYTHNDPAAVAVAIRTSPDPRRLQRIEHRLEREIAATPEHVGLVAELAHVQALRGKRDESRASYARATALAGTDAELLRHVEWSRGWSLVNLDDPRGALAAWAEAARLHGGTPHWVPYTYALGLWALGERDAALRWYDAAVASYPEEWGTRRGMNAMTAHWNPKERALMKALFATWDAAAKPD